MGIYIPGMELPENGHIFSLVLKSDGAVIGANDGKAAGKAIELPPHGRLGDLDALFDKAYTAYGADMDEPEANRMMEMISAASTILPADHSADTGKMINDDSEYEESLDSRVVQALEHGFYATMYGEVYKPDRPIIFIKSDEAWWNPKLGGICFIWGYPGPDISIYRPGQYGITWALMEHELKGYCAADPEKEDT